MTPDELLAHLDRLGIATRTVRHPPVFTVEEGRALWATIPGGHCKNLFLTDGRDARVLVSALEDTAVDVNRLHRRLGTRRLSFGKPDLLVATLGVAPGSVTPFALVHDLDRCVEVVLDARFAGHEVLNFHPLSNAMTTSIARADLGRFLEALGYRARTVDFAAPLP
jgi:Ala-tRNA(Pro) deacylase